LRPTAIQALDADGALLAVAESEADGNWPRAQLNPGARDPNAVFVRAVVPSASAWSQAVALENAWFPTSGASDTPPSAARVFETSVLDAPRRSGRRSPAVRPSPWSAVAHEGLPMIRLLR
jgi:hypothetical protein